MVELVQIVRFHEVMESFRMDSNGQISKFIAKTSINEHLEECSLTERAELIPIFRFHKVTESLI